MVAKKPAKKVVQKRVLKTKPAPDAIRAARTALLERALQDLGFIYDKNILVTITRHTEGVLDEAVERGVAQLESKIVGINDGAAQRLADAIYARLDNKLHEEVSIVVKRAVNDVSWNRIWGNIRDRNPGKELVPPEGRRPWWRLW